MPVIHKLVPNRKPIIPYVIHKAYNYCIAHYMLGYPVTLVIRKAQGESILSMGINTWEICYTLLCIAISISPASSKDLWVNYISVVSSRGQWSEVVGTGQ